MANTGLDFKIRSGRSTELFEEDGKTPKQGVKLELGCWYLCVDTVCVYVCVEHQKTGEKTLVRVNATSFDAVEDRVSTLEQRVNSLEDNVEEVIEDTFKELMTTTLLYGGNANP